ncbi:peroxiredoxin-2-like isoform X1 [Ostrea edulis]|uniref:peroxiredoxin-2-like isoform X1 n=1 Tax=Ostrea edulis TaxID=37623 RepID=UPI0024AFCD04|nr:peroxiredoxin-2-like isoform X1 [Ostrea edulis]
MATSVNMLLLGIVFFVVCTLSRAADDEKCQSFAGGSVFPQETRRTSGHAIQWSQAVISKPAPDFNGTAVIKGEFKDIKLTDYKGKYLVFFFYPLDFTFVCPTEIIAFSDRVGEFKKINTEVIACSVDSQFTHLAWINTARAKGGLGPLNIPLLSDITHEISKAYGVYLQDLGHSLRGLFIMYTDSTNVMLFKFLEDYLSCILTRISHFFFRGLFIIDPKGILRQITMNDLPVGRSVDETLRLVQAFQYTDTHGEVCPAGWKPGSDTIIPDPKESQKYFSKLNDN